MNQNEEITNWLNEECDKLTTTKNYEEKPYLQLQPNVMVEIEIDFSEPFNEWHDKQDATKMKKIIPVTSKGVKYNWWLNPKNPIYRDLIKLGKDGQTKFKVVQTGTQKDTKYNLVK